MKNVCKLNIALSDNPLYISVNDQDMSINSIMEDAIKSLNDSGRNFESTQLNELYKDHEVTHKGKVLGKGELFKNMSYETREVNNEKVNFIEFDLIKHHVGGL